MNDSLPLQIATECAKQSDFRRFPRVREAVEQFQTSLQDRLGQSQAHRPPRSTTKQQKPAIPVSTGIDTQNRGNSLPRK